MKMCSDWWIIYFDGAVNVCDNGAGAVIISPNKKQYPVSVKLQFGCTNNTVEYEVCILDLEAALELNIRKDRCVWRLNIDHLPSKRRMANQGREVKAILRIPV